MHRKAFTFWFTFTHISLTCVSKLSFLLIFTPRSFASTLCEIDCPLTFRHNLLTRLWPRDIIWNLPRLAHIPFSVNQVSNFWRSFSNQIVASSKDVLQEYNVVSSAKFHISDSMSMRNISFMKTLNNNGPRTDPCGTIGVTDCRARDQTPRFDLIQRLLCCTSHSPLFCRALFIIYSAGPEAMAPWLHPETT